MKHQNYCFLLLLLGILIVSCQPSRFKTSNSPDINHDLDKQAQIQNQNISWLVFIDPDGTPVPNVSVDTTDKILISDKSGVIYRNLEDDGPSKIIITAENFVSLQLEYPQKTLTTIQLTRRLAAPALTWQGSVVGVETKDKDGWIDFALVMESLTKTDIMDFNINKVISPWSSKISVMGFSFPIPNNLFLPEQKETYFIPISLQKSWYTLNYDSSGTKFLHTLRGQFPFKPILQELQNKKPLYELINYFNFNSAGSSKVLLVQNGNGPTLESNKIVIEKTINVQVPTIANDQVLLGITGNSIDDFFQPTDIKYFKSNETKSLNVVDEKSYRLLLILKNKNEFIGESPNVERMSASITQSIHETLLPPLLPDLQIINNTVKIILPDLIGLEPCGFILTVSELKSYQTQDGQTVKYKAPIYQIHSPVWSENIQLPSQVINKTNKYRVELTLLATHIAKDSTSHNLMPQLPLDHYERIQKATHFTKTAADF